MCGLKEIETENMDSKEGFLLKMSETLINHYILVNPDEIFEFIKDKEGLYGFIIEIANLVKEFFPDARFYLEFYNDPEISALDSLYGFIYNESDSRLENEKRFCALLKQYYILEDNFKDFKNFFVIDLIDDNIEYIPK